MSTLQHLTHLFFHKPWSQIGPKTPENFVNYHHQISKITARQSRSKIEYSFNLCRPDPPGTHFFRLPCSYQSSALLFLKELFPSSISRLCSNSAGSTSASQ
ncbi:hypothetical protein T08_14022 [Trichinella sp. T8]|nr:hypothetical protein T08_14022 [Trichinella sp. T8]